MSDWVEVSTVDWPRPDVTLVDGFLLDSTDLGDRLPNVTTHVRVDAYSFDPGVVETAKVQRSQQRKPVCLHMHKVHDTVCE